jgi:hypothetical protein
MRAVPDYCEGHRPGEVLADLVVNIVFVGRGRTPFTYAMCIDCAEQHYEMVDAYDPVDFERIREYWWMKHRNCERLV